MDQIWSDALDTLQKRLNPQTFETWFGPTRLVSAEEDRLLVEVPDDFCRDLLISNYRPLLQEILNQLTGRAVEVEFVLPVSQEQPDSSEPFSQESPVQTTNDMDSGKFLNPVYNFSSFVVGGSNQFAHAAAVAVAENPARVYNPLFIYGGVGLGKTHLMHAIGHQILKRAPGLQLIYASSEAFTNEVILSIQENRMAEFRRKFRQVDILMIDDIQFIAGKDATQTEFFHTFNALHERGNQIVISSDTYPKDLQNMEARLISRFGSGLVADIQPPALETKMAILQKKAALQRIDLPHDVALYIASRIKSNIRELEGALTRLAAYSQLLGRPPTPEFARDVLRDLIQAEEQVVTVEMVQREVARYYDLKLAAMKSKSRTRSVVFPRQVAMFLSRELTSLSLPDIGQKFGGKDHTTVLYAVRRVEGAMAQDPIKRSGVEHIRRVLTS